MLDFLSSLIQIPSYVLINFVCKKRLSETDTYIIYMFYVLGNTELALKRAIKNKQHKTSALKLKLQETKQVMSQATESNEKINALLTNAETNDSDKALVSSYTYLLVPMYGT